MVTRHDETLTGAPVDLERVAALPPPETAVLRRALVNACRLLALGAPDKAERIAAGMIARARCELADDRGNGKCTTGV